MLKKCPACKKKKEMRSNQKYCSPKCKKNYENSLRSAPNKSKVSVSKKSTQKQEKTPSPSGIKRPQWLNAVAASYWDEIAPVVCERGHLNVLSANSFAEMCDLYSRLCALNQEMDKGTKDTSDKKLKYSKQFLDYCKAFYLTPLSNRGNFGLEDKEDIDPHDEFLEMAR